LNLKDGLTDSEWAAKVLGHPVIKAFNNILSQSLASKSKPEGSPDRIALSVAGDEEEHKQIVQALIKEMGFDAIDGGSLSGSWRQQPGTPAYCQDLDKEALAAALQEADVSKRAQYLEMADEAIRPFL
jgi:predicted dinucleotide-binding enzyme